jgi:hypothetical protein
LRAELYVRDKGKKKAPNLRRLAEKGGLEIVNDQNEGKIIVRGAEQAILRIASDSRGAIGFTPHFDHPDKTPEELAMPWRKARHKPNRGR